MRIAIISDSHGNLTALDAVLTDIDRNGPFDAVLFGGDVAYGGPFPRECIDRVAERGYRMVRGNTDQMIVDASTGAEDPNGQWVVRQLERSHLELLGALPVSQVVAIDQDQSLTLVHATPWSIYDTVLPDHGDESFARMLADAGTHALAYGHIHLQHQRNLPTGIVVAVGSVGLPFDRDQRAMYTVIEASSRSWNVEFRRVSYDVDTAIQQSLDTAYPNGPAFANNLRTASRP